MLNIFSSIIAQVETLSPQLPAIPVDSVALVSNFVTALVNGDWIAVTSLLLMIVVFVLNRFIVPALSLDDEKKKFIPLISLVLSFIMAVATIITNPTVPVVSTMITALVTATASVGTWEMLFKHLWKATQKPNKTKPKKKASKPKED